MGPTDSWNGKGSFPTQIGAAGLHESFLAAISRRATLPGSASRCIRTRPTRHDRHQLANGVEQMTLSAQTRLGPYEILAPIGAGGMGTVYKARDTRLDRIVAIKIAQEKFSERFDREARAVAALNHPHICALYDVGPNYLVME